MGVVRILEARKISIYEINEREEHRESGDICALEIVVTVDEHTADERRYDP